MPIYVDDIDYSNVPYMKWTWYVECIVFLNQCKVALNGYALRRFYESCSHALNGYALRRFYESCSHALNGYI